jgi:hypothetical protein
VCTAGALGCNLEVVSTCGANGGSWINPGTNCAASSQVCVLGGSCAAQEVATQGSTTYTDTYSSTSELALFRALGARNLSKIEIYASVTGLQKFTWVVYQKRPSSNSFELVYQAVTSQAAPSQDWVSSPALNFNFVAGKTYAVGVHITGSAKISYSYGATLSYARAAFLTAATSSQVPEGAATQPSAVITPVNSSYQPYLRFTTVLAP